MLFRDYTKLRAAATIQLHSRSIPGKSPGDTAETRRLIIQLQQIPFANYPLYATNEFIFKSYTNKKRQPHQLSFLF